MRLAVLASGRGTNLEAILTAGLPAAVVVVDRPCPAQEIAERHGVPSALVQRDSFGPDFDRKAYSALVVDVLEASGVELIAMAGFMTIFEQPVFDAYDGCILNTHPSLLPAFRGAHAVRDALAYGVKVTGITVHVATMDLDAGPILAQEAVPVVEGDTEAVLHERIKTVERRLYPATIRAILERGSVL